MLNTTTDFMRCYEGARDAREAAEYFMRNEAVSVENVIFRTWRELGEHTHTYWVWAESTEFKYIQSSNLPYYEVSPVLRVDVSLDGIKISWEMEMPMAAPLARGGRPLYRIGMLSKIYWDDVVEAFGGI